MSEKTVNIYQIYHQSTLKPNLDPAFVPFDHCEFTANNPDLSNSWREWPVIRDLGLKQAQADNADIWGFVSYKFQEKTNVTGQQFIDFIKDNPDNDVWFLEPYYTPRNPFLNPWQQGELYHPGITQIPNFIFKAAGNDIDVSKIPMRLSWYNFFAGTEKFWNLYFEVIDTIINVAKEHEGLNEVLFNTGAGHGNDPRVPYFIFVVERMFPTILAMSDLKAASLIYKHSDFQLAPFFLNTVDKKFNQSLG
jgi:hypothetical protein